MSDTNPDLAAQEVDDDLRRDRMHELWKAYGKFIVGGAIGIVIAVGGTQLYKYQVRTAQEANSAAFTAAEKAAGADAAGSANVWASNSLKLEGGYAALADLRRAAAQAKVGDVAAAVESYDALAASSKGDLILRGYAQLLAALLVLDKTGDLDEARGRFSVLATAGQPWYFSSVEQLAFIDMKQGDIETAYDRFASLVDNSGTPQSIRGRAQQFRDMLERQLPSPDIEAPIEDVDQEAVETPNEG